MPSPVVTIAGATGFVGTNLANDLSEKTDFTIQCLTRRSTPPNETRKRVRWIQADSYDLSELTQILRGTDVLVYLIHSMLPSATLMQGSFADTDAYLADNFARASKEAGVRQIVYLGGLIPDDSRLSDHLKSRLEIEGLLGSQGVPVTTFRAGLIVGPGGSSFEILERLVRRLPAMLCPAWTSKRSQSIDIRDVIAIVSSALGRQEYFGKTFDVGAKDLLTYREMLERTASALGLKRLLISVPILSPKISRLWVKTITGAPSSLVYPLVESLKHELVVRRNHAFKEVQPRYTFEESLKDTLRYQAENPASMGRLRAMTKSFTIHKDVRSIQRLTVPHEWTARDVANHYLQWLPKLLHPLVSVRGNSFSAELRFLSLVTLIELKWPQSTDSNRQREDIAVLKVTGGLLVRKPVEKKGRLEFREMPGKKELLCHLQDFRPALPWVIYKFTQAPVHRWVIYLFQRWMGKGGE